MNDVMIRIVACVVCACVFAVSTVKSVGAMQQGGYKNGAFLRWLKRKENMYYNRLCVLSLCLVLATSVTALCFSFLGTRIALSVSAFPFFGLTLLYTYSDGKYALKVPFKKTGRFCRLFAVYWLMIACVAYILIAALWFLSEWNGSTLYALIAYAPFAIMPLLLPYLLCLANAVEGIFENARNKKFVLRAGQTLEKSEIIRVGIVGSFGKTSVKNILKTILSEKYSVVETPESYNTPIGIAKTVFSPEFENKQVFIAEMGARKSGDISTLRDLVKPDYVVFTGVCEQHIATFGSIENVWAEKKEILHGNFKVAVLGEDLKTFAGGEFDDESRIVFAKKDCIKEARYLPTKTVFSLVIDGAEIPVETALLGEAAVENIQLAATLASKMGLTAAEIARGIEKLKPVPHRLQLLKNGGVYILDDGYNCNPRGAKQALFALGRFEGRKCVVTPGIVECGVLEESENQTLGKEIAALAPDKVILVGNTLVGAVKSGYADANGDMEKLTVVKTLTAAQKILSDWLLAGDCVLFLNDLPDVY